MVHLRELLPTDDARLAELAADADVRQWNPLRPADDPAAWRAEAAADRTTTLAIADTSESAGVLLGTVALFDVDEEQGTAQIGYRVHPGARGRGVGTAAVRAAVALAFGELGLRRLALFHAVANPASCRVAERAGLRLEGTLREGYVYGDGAAYDEHLHACLATNDRGLTARSARR